VRAVLTRTHTHTHKFYCRGGLGLLDILFLYLFSVFFPFVSGNNLPCLHVRLTLLLLC
jgi:hypothetical protein